MVPEIAEDFQKRFRLFGQTNTAAQEDLMNQLKNNTKYSGKISLDHKDGFYQTGETAICRVTLLKGRKPIKGEKARMTLRWNGYLVETRDFETTGKPVEFVCEGKQPGWAYFGFEVLDSNGNPLSGPGVYKHHMKPTIVTEIGAMFDPEKIVSSVIIPEDFDEFWKNRRAEVRDILPLHPEIKELDSRTPGVKLFSVTIPGPRGLHASGYLAYPETAEPKSLKARLFFQSLTYTDALRPQALNMAKNGLLGFSASWHGFPTAQSLKYYPEVIKPYFQHGFKGLENRETWVYSDMFFRVMCEMEFVKSLPQWNGRDLIVSGGSLGGIQSIFAAAIDPQVTLAIIAVPSSCECNAFEAGRTPNGVFRRIPLEELKCHPEYLESGLYYDSVCFAKWIRCESYVCTGFTDESCHPGNVYAFYNAIPSGTKKHMSTNPLTGHYGTTSDPCANAKIRELFSFVKVSNHPIDWDHAKFQRKSSSVQTK